MTSDTKRLILKIYCLLDLDFMADYFMDKHNMFDLLHRTSLFEEVRSTTVYLRDNGHYFGEMITFMNFLKDTHIIMNRYYLSSTPTEDPEKVTIQVAIVQTLPSMSVRSELVVLEKFRCDGFVFNVSTDGKAFNKMSPNNYLGRTIYVRMEICRDVCDIGAFLENLILSHDHYLDRQDQQDNEDTFMIFYTKIGFQLNMMNKIISCT